MFCRMVLSCQIFWRWLISEPKSKYNFGPPYHLKPEKMANQERITDLASAIKWRAILGFDNERHVRQVKVWADEIARLTDDIEHCCLGEIEECGDNSKSLRERPE